MLMLQRKSYFTEGARELISAGRPPVFAVFADAYEFM